MPLECPDCPLNPEGWARLWGALPMVLDELQLYEEMVRQGDKSEETRAIIEHLQRRVEMAKAASLCCCPEHARAVAQVCVEELLYDRSLRRVLSLDNAVDTAKARLWWLVECVKDGCHE